MKSTFSKVFLFISFFSVVLFAYPSAQAACNEGLTAVRSKPTDRIRRYTDMMQQAKTKPALLKKINYMKGVLAPDFPASETRDALLRFCAEKPDQMDYLITYMESVL